MLHRHARPAVAGAYTLGAVVGALTTTTALVLLNGLVSPLPSNIRTGLAVCLLALLGLHATRILCLDLPERRYQIPRETFTSEPTRAAFRFAFELGMGVRTYITAVSPYALAIVLLLALPSTLGSAVFAALAAALGYGLGRSVVVATQSMRRTIAVDHPSVWLRAADLVALILAVAVVVTA